MTVNMSSCSIRFLPLLHKLRYIFRVGQNPCADLVDRSLVIGCSLFALLASGTYSCFFGFNSVFSLIITA